LVAGARLISALLTPVAPGGGGPWLVRRPHGTHHIG
jgi:hypothetical protein